jgi:drug/metabolite transporter (DMT)-like permease
MGSLSNPGTGLFPFLLGIAIGALSLIMLTQTFIEKQTSQEKDLSYSKAQSKIKPFFILLALLAYGLLLSSLGHIVTTFLLFTFLLRMITPHRWSVVIGGALLASIGSYVLFQLALNVQLPKGILGI